MPFGMSATLLLYPKEEQNGDIPSYNGNTKNINKLKYFFYLFNLYYEIDIHNIKVKSFHFTSPHPYDLKAGNKGHVSYGLMSSRTVVGKVNICLKMN